MCATKSPELGKETRESALKVSGFFLSEIDPTGFLVPVQEAGEDDVTLQERTIKNRSMVAQLYSSIVRRLDDSDENIRVLACSVLLYFNDWVAVVKSLGLATLEDSDPSSAAPAPNSAEAHVSLTGKLPSFSQYLDHCCLRLVVGDPSKMFKSRMDSLLKGAAMTDVAVFRTSVDAFLAAHEHLDPDVKDICDRLLEHVEVMASFEAMKSKKTAKDAPEMKATAVPSSYSGMVSVPIQDDDGMDSADEIYANDDIDDD